MSEESIIREIKKLRSNDPDIRWSGVNNLRKYLHSHTGDYRARMITKSLLNLVKDTDDRIRETVITTLIEIFPHGQKLEPIIIGMLSDKSPSIRSISLEWISRQNHHLLRDFTLKLLRDQSEAVRKSALDIVISKQISGTEDILLELLKSESGGLRRSVIFALGKIKTPKAIDNLTEIMTDPHYDDLTRNQASAALERIGGKDLIIPFIENLIDPNEYVRGTAAAFLKKNESEMISTISSSGKIKYIALLYHATNTTKYDFDSAITTLTNQMSFLIKDLSLKLLLKDEIDLEKLTKELQTIDIITSIIIDKILNIMIFPKKDRIYLTNTGLKNLLLKEIIDKNSLYIPILRKKEPFNHIETDILIETISKIESAQMINKNLFLSKESFSKIKLSIENNGILDISLLAREIHQQLDIIKKELIQVLYPSQDSWYNEKNEYLTITYLKSRISQEIEHFHIFSLKNFLNQVAKPKIDQKLLKQIIDENHKGYWLSDIGVFIELSEYQNIEQNSAKIDESLVKHLLKHIDIDYPTFLTNLQKILDIQVYKTEKGQILSLENLQPILSKKIFEKGYLSIDQLLEELKLEKNAKNVIVDYLIKEFQGKTDLEQRYFFRGQFIAEIQKETEPLRRINFNVLSFKLNLPKEVLTAVIKQILLLNGITNSMGEFITIKGIDLEIQEILDHRDEFRLQELFELLEVENDYKSETIILDVIHKNSKVWISRDKTSVISHKGAFKNIISYLKSSDSQTKQKLSFDEISQKTNVPKEHIHVIIKSLIDNSLLTGTLDDKSYKTQF